MEKLTSLPICRLLIIQYSFFKSTARCTCFDDFRIDYVCIFLCGESFDLLKNSEKPVGEMNRLSLTGPAVKRNFLGIAWRRWLYVLV